MDESTIKGMKLLELEGRKSTDDEANRNFRICVEGYDPSLGGVELESPLRRHFSSCGTIMNIVIPREVGSRSVIHIRGEDAEKKALELNGSDMGGWRVVVKPFPYTPELNPDLGASAKSFTPRGCVDVTGYDISLPKDVIERALIKHFSSCGEICVVVVFDNICNARVLIRGEGAVEKAVKLNGCGSECECDVLGCKFVAKKLIPVGTVRGRQSTGYTVPDRCIPKGKRAKV